MKIVFLCLIVLLCVRASVVDVLCANCDSNKAVAVEKSDDGEEQVQPKSDQSPRQSIIILKTKADPPSFMSRVISLLTAIVMTVCAAIVALRTFLIGLFAILFVVVMISLIAHYCYYIPLPPPLASVEASVQIMTV